MPTPTTRPKVGDLVFWRARTKADQKALGFFTKPWLVHRLLDSLATRSRPSTRSLLLIPYGGDDKPVSTAARWVPEENVHTVLSNR